MDASDRGLCALWPARKEYLQVEFDEEELQQIEKGNAIGADELSINIRELMSGVFAPVVWASKWSQAVPDYHTHIRFWIDNSSAVCWANRRSSRNPFAQMLLRLIALGDFCSHVVCLDTGQSPTEPKETMEPLGAGLRARVIADTSRIQYRRAWNQ
ncbi:hypothetical protein JG688_00007813 [Phytophthora aleatoria]|uniref:Uncharacterized protein n=1 Tax=Phytophthora aleatoria TaxID=2496075 RepID=A0A8J5J7J2_9STRA|nr:hypothetical protein JG688_00007813 [Phytophthora aleatoria]